MKKALLLKSTGVEVMANNKEQHLRDGQHFYSKRNQVTYAADQDCVRKKHFDPEAYKNEIWVYEKLSLSPLVRVPKVISEDEESLLLTLSFIHGTLLLDRLTICEAEGSVNEAVVLFARLYDWLDGFYEGMSGSYILKDVNLRNFIVHEETIYGLDFEMVTEGDTYKEKCMVLAMYQMYDPADTSFKKWICEAVIDKCFEKADDAREEIDQCRKIIKDRRKGKAEE